MQESRNSYLPPHCPLGRLTGGWWMGEDGVQAGWDCETGLLTPSGTENPFIWVWPYQGEKIETSQTSVLLFFSFFFTSTLHEWVRHALFKKCIISMMTWWDSPILCWFISKSGIVGQFVNLFSSAILQYRPHVCPCLWKCRLRRHMLFNVKYSCFIT